MAMFVREEGEEEGEENSLILGDGAEVGEAGDNYEFDDSILLGDSVSIHLGEAGPGQDEAELLLDDILPDTAPMGEDVALGGAEHLRNVSDVQRPLTKEELEEPLPAVWSREHVLAKLFLTREHSLLLWLRSVASACGAPAVLSRVRAPNIYEALRDGVVLLHVAAQYAPQKLRLQETVKHPRSASECRRNLSEFLRFVRALGYPRRSLFRTNDLLRKQNLRKVMKFLCVFAKSLRGFKPKYVSIPDEDVSFPDPTIREAMHYLRWCEERAAAKAEERKLQQVAEERAAQAALEARWREAAKIAAAEEDRRRRAVESAAKSNGMRGP